MRMHAHATPFDSTIMVISSTAVDVGNLDVGIDGVTILFAGVVGESLGIISASDVATVPSA